MKIGKTLKKVLQRKEGKMAIGMVVVGCVLAFVFATAISSRALGTMMQIGCCLLAIFGCQAFTQVVVQVQDEERNSKKK